MLALQIPLTTLPTVNYSYTSCGSYSRILQSALQRIKVQESTKNLTLNSAGRKQVAKKLKKACRTRWLSLDKLVFKEKIKEKIGIGVYGILIDEVTDISLTQQLVTFIQYYDSQSCTTTTSFLAISNTLKGNNSADAPQIKKVLLEQLQSVGLEVQTMRSFVSDGASVMTGARNGVAKLLKDENPLILSFHCLAHKLALACASSADTLDYIAHC